MSINFQKINEEVIGRSDSFISSFVSGGTFGTGTHGRYYSVNDPVQSEDHPSLTIWPDTGMFKNHAKQISGGDFISLYAYLQGGLQMNVAAEQVADWLGMAKDEYSDDPKPAQKKKQPHKTPPLRGWIKKAGWRKPANTWEYFIEDGDDFTCVAIVYRFDLPDGGKTFKQLKRVEGGWAWGGLGANRPLLNLPTICREPEKDLLFHEGEKAADAGEILYTDKVSVATMQGSESPEKTNYKHVKDKNCYIWPDNDLPGVRYTKKLVQLLTEAGAANILVLKIPSHWPEKYDAANFLEEGLDPSQLEWLPYHEIEQPEELTDEVGEFIYKEGKLYHVRVLQNSVKHDLVYNGHITITRSSTDIDTEKTYIQLNFDTPMGTKQAIMPLEELATKRGILKLSGFGATLPETRAHLASQYVVDLFDVKKVPHQKQTALIGRVEDGLVLPNISIGTDVIYYGDSDIQENFKGEDEEIYKKTLEEVFTWGMKVWPLILQLGMSLSAPFVDMVGLKRNPCFVFYGPSGYGKTTCAKFCLAAWGNPDAAPLKSEGATANTQVGIDQNLNRLVGLPFLIDEIHKMPVVPRGKEISFERLVFRFANAQTRMLGSINEMKPRGGKHTTGTMLACGENLPLMDDQGALKRLTPIHVAEHPPLGYSGVDKQGKQNSDGWLRVKALNNAREHGFGYFGAKFFGYVLERKSALLDKYKEYLENEDIIKLDHHRETFALVMATLNFLIKFLGLAKTPLSIAVIPQAMQQIIEELSCGGDNDPDVQAFEKLTSIVTSSTEQVERINLAEVGKGFYMLNGEVVAFKKVRKGGVECYCIPTNTNAFKQRLGAGAMRQYGTAWARLGLIQVSGTKTTHLIRRPDGGLGTRCVIVPQNIVGQEDDDLDLQDE